MKIIHLDDTIGAINPMRYKGYYYDSETKYYWLNSRFYVPSWRRFLSPDKLGDLDLQKFDRVNLFVYVNCCPGGGAPAPGKAAGLRRSGESLPPRHRRKPVPSLCRTVVKPAFLPLAGGYTARPERRQTSRYAKAVRSGPSPSAKNKPVGERACHIFTIFVKGGICNPAKGAGNRSRKRNTDYRKSKTLRICSQQKPTPRAATCCAPKSDRASSCSRATPCHPIITRTTPTTSGRIRRSFTISG